MSIRDHLDAAATLPWKAERAPRRWTKVVDANGESFEDMTFLPMHGLMLGVGTAMLPDLLDYVERAAEKGGAEAKSIMGRFYSEIERLKDFP